MCCIVLCCYILFSLDIRYYVLNNSFCKMFYYFLLFCYTLFFNILWCVVIYFVLLYWYMILELYYFVFLYIASFCVTLHWYTLCLHVILWYGTIRSRAKSTLSTILHFLHTRIFNSQKNTDPSKNSTYVQYVTVLTSVMSLSRNRKTPMRPPNPPKMEKSKNHLIPLHQPTQTSNESSPMLPRLNVSTIATPPRLPSNSVALSQRLQ